MSAERLRKQIFVGCRQLGLDSETRHDLQLAATGKSSLKDMSEAELQLVVKHLRARGFNSSGKKRPAAKRPDIRYCHVLWRLLHQAGYARIGGAKGLNAFIRSPKTGFEPKWGHVPIDIDAMTETSEINDVIEALKAWCRREGIPTELGGGR
ncbi:MAG: phage protein GemA/Gp16 family protein [Thalassovita sp.]